MSERFDRLAKMVAGGVSRRDALKGLGGLLAGAFLFGLGGKSRADDDEKGGGGDNEEINEICQKYCRGCPDKPKGVNGQCMSQCKQCLHKGGFACGSCTTAAAFTCCASAAATCCNQVAGTAPYCANLSTDATNCGKCANACAKGQGCCAGTCTDLNTTKNCGACGKACTAGTTPGCCPNAAGANTCVDLASDNANCGKCGNVCGVVNGVQTTCQGGTCK